MLWTEKAKKILEKLWGFSNLKEKQEEIINELLNGNDVVGILPTGYGKSLCYILPPLLIKNKIMLIVSPLISLMIDQSVKLKEKGIPVAVLNSENENRNEEIKQIKNGEIKIIFITPEYLINGYGMTLCNYLIVNNMLGWLAIDESHCISSWGSDFRKSYLELGKFRKEFEDINILALTATATQDVVNDIKIKLNLHKPKIIQADFNRSNLYIECYDFSQNKKNKLNPVDKITEYINKYPDEKIIVYIKTRDKVDDITKNINDIYNYSICGAYHAGLKKTEKDDIQNKFIIGEIKVIICTIAFSMGIDLIIKCVIIIGVPSSISEYYQMIGRSGRNGIQSENILLFENNQVGKLVFLIKNDKYLSENIKKNKINNLYQMKEYVDNNICRHKYLIEYFSLVNLKLDKNYKCNNCDNCLKKKIIQSTPTKNKIIIENLDIYDKYEKMSKL
jgi:RecQ family ATP-dependent DNA helicase